MKLSLVLRAMNSKLQLGYCCLNTRLQKDGIFCSRTMRLATFKSKGLAYAQELALKNLADLATIIKWNADNNFKVFRVSSDIFPMASHPDCVYSLDFAQAELKVAGDLARATGQRLTMHPSQHHVLTAVKDTVLKNSILGLEHECDILDRMGMDKQSVMVIHGGGVYGDKPAALLRLETNILALKSNLRDRLVLENDEMSYTVEDLLPISEKLGIPIVVDFHHDAILPGSLPVTAYLDRVYAVWDRRGIKPKVHVSQSPPGVTSASSFHERRCHGPYIDTLPDALVNSTRELDVMFEAKMKEESVFRYIERHSKSSGAAETIVDSSASAVSETAVAAAEKAGKVRKSKRTTKAAECDAEVGSSAATSVDQIATVVAAKSSKKKKAQKAPIVVVAKLAEVVSEAMPEAKPRKKRRLD